MNFEEYRSRESERIQANRKRMEEDGVIFQDIYNAYVDDSVVIEEGAFIACNVTLKGNTVIHREAFIWKMRRSVPERRFRPHTFWTVRWERTPRWDLLPIFVREA